MTPWLIGIGVYLAIGLVMLVAELRHGFGAYDWPEIVGLVLFWPLVGLIVLLAYWRAARMEKRRRALFGDWRDNNWSDNQ